VFARCLIDATIDVITHAEAMIIAEPITTAETVFVMLFTAKSFIFFQCFSGKNLARTSVSHEL